MKNIINFYYNLNILNIYNLNGSYYFTYKNSDYFLISFDRPINEANTIYNLYLELKKRRIMTNSIVLNKDNQIITFVNNIPYILIIDNIGNKQININDILYFQNNTFNILCDKKIYRNDWTKMWQIKIDYYEEQMVNTINKYKLLNNTLDYYIGLGENAICYLVNSKVKNNAICLSHKRIDINKSSFDFYNPINYIIDNRVRDFCEYIKNLYFLDNIDFNDFKYYLDYMDYTRDEYVLLIARLLFPTYYFDLFDLIISNNYNEEIIRPVIEKTNDYLSFIKKVMIYIIYQKNINLPYIEWIIKDAT